MNKEDRCDRCTAEAMHKVQKGSRQDGEAIPNGLTLLFCNHHYEQHKDKLSAWTVVESKLVPA